jgi:hypothetical protein
MTDVRLLVAMAGTVAVASLVTGTSAPGLVATPARCHADVSRAVLPIWARAGFSGPTPRLPHVLGRNGRIVAIVFGYPLRSPPAPGRNNKILWVSRTLANAPSALWIRAQRMEGGDAAGAPVRHVVPGGPGPSLIDLPRPGCWRLTLSWSGRTDSLDLAYGSGR